MSMLPPTEGESSRFFQVYQVEIGSIESKAEIFGLTTIVLALTLWAEDGREIERFDG